MPINPEDLVKQIEAQSERLLKDGEKLRDNIEEALALYKKSSTYELNVAAQQKTRKDITTARPITEPNEVVEIRPTVGEYCVVATDSSPIPPDRHNGTSLYYVINVGKVMLRYGPDSEAEIDSVTLFEAGDVASEEQETMAASLLDTRSALEELKVAFEMARQHKATVVFRDGPLTLWRSINLRGQKGTALRNEYYQVLGQFQTEGIPVIGYISNTHSDSVVDTLRALAQNQNSSARFAGVQDAMLFRQLLPENSRGPIFGTVLNEPKELQEHIGDIYFTYLHTPFEMVRLEFPQWLADDPQKLATSLAIVQKQSELGQGYPVALMEAHESAVLRGDDRELLRILLEERGLLQTESEKGRSKRLRGI